METHTKAKIEPDALQEQMRQHYAQRLAKMRQPGEFTVAEYILANADKGLKLSSRSNVTILLKADPKISVREDGIDERGKHCNYFKFIT